MSDGLTPASANARGPDQTAPEWVRSRSRPPRGPLGASPAPRTRTFGRFSDRATSGLVTIRAPPPSVTTQQSSRWSGSEIIREFTTSSTVTTSRRKACSFHFA